MNWKATSLTGYMDVDVAINMDGNYDMANDVSDDVDEGDDVNAKIADDVAADMDIVNHFQPIKYLDHQIWPSFSPRL